MENNTPDSSVAMTETPAAVTSTDNEVTPTPTPLSDPDRELSLWELMRKDAETPRPDGSDDTARVLSCSRPSIWDMD